MPKFEPYNYRMGCLAVQIEDKWWVVKPNGSYQRAATKADAQAKAAHLNVTASAEERQLWREPIIL